MKFNRAILIAKFAALSSAAGLIKRDDQCSCTVEPLARKDCGYIGINESACVSNGCCWDPSNVDGAPWCFYTASGGKTTECKSSESYSCEVDESSRTDCGYYGINESECVTDEKSRVDCGYIGVTKRQCEAAGCCWAESETDGIPWCFNEVGKDIHIEKEGITVRFQKPYGWSTVNLWAWDDEDNNVYGEVWPGKTISDIGDGWYSYTFPSDVSSVNVLFNDGNNQTKDITNIKSSSCFKLVGDNVMKTDDCGLGPSGCSYTITDLKTSESGMTAVLDLEDRICEKYDIDIPKLDFQAKFETNDRLHIHIQPTDIEDYPHNVDVPEDAYPFEIEDGPNDDLQYSYELVDGETFKININRKDGTPVFESMSFIFERQYLEISKNVDSNSAIYGFGEVFGPYKRNSENTSHALWNADNADPVGQNLYGSHPFYIEIIDGKAYGFYLKNSHGMQFSIQDGLMTIQAIGGNFDMYFFMGPSMEDITKQYFQVIGAPALLPYWSLGWHQCRYGYRNIDEVREVVANYKKNNIPLDTMWIDIDYMENNKDFTYDAKNFPVSEMKKFVNELKSNHQYYINMIDPAIAKDDNYAPFSRGMEKDIFIKDKNGELFLGEVWPVNLNTAFPDWHHPNIVEYWTNEIKLFKDLAMTDGNWIDMNEAASFCNGACNSGSDDPKFKMGEFNPRNPPFAINNFGYEAPLKTKTLDMDVQYYGGLIDYDIHNMYGHMESIVSYEALLNIDPIKRPFLLSRSTFPGTGRYAAHWLGDNHSWWKDMYYSITGMLSFQLFGIPMVGSDTCGFQANADEELCARWMALGAFNPFGRNHNGLEWDNARIRSQEPYIWPKTAEASRRALAIRYKILPYMYTYLVRTHTHSEMILYSFAALWPNDATALGIDKQFLVGKGILITPVIEQGKTSVEGYFPEGIWYDWYDHSNVITGPTYKVLNAPIEHIPVHIRGGQIIPTQGPSLTVYENRNKPFELLVALDSEKKAHGILYLDDGISYNVDGKFNEIEYNVENGTLTAKGSYNYDEPQNLHEISILGVSSKPSTVTVNDADAQFEFSNNELIIKNLDISMNDDFVVSWN
ncbi:glycosyl hydrolases family 31-domain-containing protein [Neocallimastix sp. 'constans']